MSLNENLSWGGVGAISTGGGKTVSDAFKGGEAEKVLLSPGFVLYKFNDFNTPTAPGQKALSPWWSPFEDYRHDGGWVQRRKLAGHLGVTIREFGRVTSAVKENWNSLQYLLVITLSVEVWAFFGGFAQMARIDAGSASKVKGGEGRGQTKNLPGGGTQFYIPDLTTDQVSSWRVEDLV
jgi:hypothetical protein